LEEGKRKFNWVWYRHYVFNSDRYKDVMTDNVTQVPHRYTLPLGRVLPQHSTCLKSDAKELLAPCVAELIQKTEHPFIQAITEFISPTAAFWRGKVLLAGDALATLRPQSGLGLNSAARSALLLADVLRGKMKIETWEKEALEFAEAARATGIRNSGFLGLARTKEEAEEKEKGAVRSVRS